MVDEITRVCVMVYTGPLKEKKHSTVEFYKKETVDKLIAGGFEVGVLCADIATADKKLRGCVRSKTTPEPTVFIAGNRQVAPDVFAISPEDWMNLPKKQNDVKVESTVSKIPAVDRNELAGKVAILIHEDKLMEAYNLVRTTLDSRGTRKGQNP